MTTTPKLFEGDGRVRVEPLDLQPGARPEPVTRAAARQLIEMFEAKGHSSHSGMGATLWVILHFLQENKIPYRLTAHPGAGYFVERQEPLDL